MQAKDIPNLLCVLRMLLTIPVAWAILEGRFQLALLLFLVAGFTDGLDGFLAKRFAWQSRLGGLLDPAADKLLLASAFVTLWAVGHVPGWLLAAVVGRDLIITAGALLYYHRVGPFEAEPTIISKLNSALQLLYILLTLCLLVFAAPGSEILSGLAWLVLVTTAVSGLDYVIRWSARARAARS
jgi:cardiolipin synthase (CMP-forming)